MIKVFSYGGGVQSTAALVLAAQGKIDFKTFLFCNVGDDSENPETLEYVEQVAKPFAQTHGIALHELQATRNGAEITLYGLLTRPNSRSIGIPVRMSNGAPARRSCTEDFKIKVIDRWLRGQDAKAQGAVVGLGISLDEPERVKPNMDAETMKWKENAWPLIYDMRPGLTRQDCMNVIAGAGLPIPSKSSCYFCPFHRPAVWQQMRQNQPALFWKAVELERLINERRALIGKDQVYLTRFCKPLDEVTTDLMQDELFDDLPCESGYCMV